MAPTFGIQELSWFSPKSANFPEILDACYRKGEHSEFFLWTRNLTAVNSITIGEGIAIGKGYWSI